MPLEKKTMPRPVDMEKWEIRAVGYELPLITQCTVAQNAQDRPFRVYGRNDEVSYVELQGASLSMDALHAPEMKVLADILTEQNPDGTTGIAQDSFQAYYPAHDVFTHVTRHLKSEDDKKYQRAEFYPYWHTILDPVVGAPGSFGTFNQRGLCDSPIAFQSNRDTQGIAILTDVIPLSTSVYNSVTTLVGNFHWYVPQQLPATAKGYVNADKYALQLELQKRDTSSILSDPRRQCKTLKVTTNNVQIVNGVALTTPVALTGTAGTTTVAGSMLPHLATGFYWYVVTALDSTGETLSSSIMLSGLNPTVDNSSNTLTLTRVTNAVKYNVYRASGASAPAATAGTTNYTFLFTVNDPGGGGTTFTALDTLAYTNNLVGIPAANTTGGGLGRIVLGASDLKNTGWAVSDTDGNFFAFVTYLYVYNMPTPNAYLIGDGLNSYNRWDIPGVS